MKIITKMLNKSKVEFSIEHCDGRIFKGVYEKRSVKIDVEQVKQEFILEYLRSTMKREIIPITSEEQWLELRSHDLTSTSVSALFDLNPYTTAYEVYHAHKSGIQVPFEQSERMKKGTRMERYAAEEVGIKMGWQVAPYNFYARIPELKIGSSFDCTVICPTRGKGLLEIKAVDHFIYKDNWSEEVPAHIETQARHQMLCSGEFNWIAVAAFTSIYDFHIHYFERDSEFEAGIIEAAKKFWKDVEDGSEPKPDFYRDSDVIAALYKNAGGDAIDKTGDTTFEAIASKFFRLNEERKAVEREESAAKVELHSYLQDAGSAFSNKFKITAGWTKDSVGKLVTEDMVGTYVGGRKGYRQCLIREITN